MQHFYEEIINLYYYHHHPPYTQNPENHKYEPTVHIPCNNLRYSCCSLYVEKPENLFSIAGGSSTESSQLSKFNIMPMAIPRWFFKLKNDSKINLEKQKYTFWRKIIIGYLPYLLNFKVLCKYIVKKRFSHNTRQWNKTKSTETNS